MGCGGVSSVVVSRCCRENRSEAPRPRAQHPPRGSHQTRTGQRERDTGSFPPPAPPVLHRPLAQPVGRPTMWFAVCVLIDSMILPQVHLGGSGYRGHTCVVSPLMPRSMKFDGNLSRLSVLDGTSSLRHPLGWAGLYLKHPPPPRACASAWDEQREHPPPFSL